jgi:hypothetical protein
VLVGLRAQIVLAACALLARAVGVL